MRAMYLNNCQLDFSSFCEKCQCNELHLQPFLSFAVNQCGPDSILGNMTGKSDDIFSTVVRGITFISLTKFPSYFMTDCLGLQVSNNLYLLRLSVNQCDPDSIFGQHYR